MNGDSYNITVTDEGFIVRVNRVSDQSAEYEVFADFSALLNFLHNELIGSH